MSLGEQFEPVLAAARQGADWALASLYRDLHPRVLRYLWARDPSEAEDLASETWLDVARGLHRFGGDEAGFRAWVFTIARRRLLDERRSAARRLTTPLSADRLALLGETGNVEHEALLSLEAQAALDRIVELPAEQAEVVLLRVLGDLSAREVARILGKREGTVRVLQHRALRRLARQRVREAVTE
jgi:RNA polymerase sigma-70 factor (ECF subfamily)